jgi:ABC-type dipeptide/oligopeptide/nickel transport system ATPase component
MSTLLEVRNLKIEFDTKDGRRRVVDGVDFEIAEGEVLGILGESGSGKTLTTLAVLGLVHGTPGIVSGQIILYQGGVPIDLLDGLDRTVREVDGRVRKNERLWAKLVNRRMRPIWGSTMTAVFQNPRASLDPVMTIGVQVSESVRLATPNLGKSDIRQAGIDWLARVQMNNPGRVFDSYAHELSGGMCQRAMIAIALARKPRLLIADEPTTGLDTTVRAEIVQLFRGLLREESRAMIYISHDVREVLYLSDRVMVMRHGRVLETAAAESIQRGEGSRADYTTFLLNAAGITSTSTHG